MQVKPVPPPYMICNDRAMIRWSSWRECSLTIWQRHSAHTESDGTAMSKVAMVAWGKSRNLIPQEIVAVVARVGIGRQVM